MADAGGVERDAGLAPPQSSATVAAPWASFHAAAMWNAARWTS